MSCMPCCNNNRIHQFINPCWPLHAQNNAAYLTQDTLSVQCTIVVITSLSRTLYCRTSRVDLILNPLTPISRTWIITTFELFFMKTIIDRMIIIIMIIIISSSLSHHPRRYSVIKDIMAMKYGNCVNKIKINMLKNQLMFRTWSVTSIRQFMLIIMMIT